MPDAKYKILEICENPLWVVKSITFSDMRKQSGHVWAISLKPPPHIQPLLQTIQNGPNAGKPAHVAFDSAIMAMLYMQCRHNDVDMADAVPAEIMSAISTKTNEDSDLVVLRHIIATADCPACGKPLFDETIMMDQHEHKFAGFACPDCKCVVPLFPVG